MKKNTKAKNNKTKSINIRGKKFEFDESKLLAVLSYFGILFIIPFLMKKKDEFAIYHAKQGIYFFIVLASTWIISKMMIFGKVFAWIFGFISLGFFVYGVTSALANKKNPLPIFGEYFEELKI